MNEIRVFENVEFGRVRTTVINGKEYFYGTDVAKALMYERPSKAVNDHCKGILTQDTIKNNGGYPEKLIPEGDVYRLIIKASMQSTNISIKEKADRFEKWIFDSVLPEIRKYGSYSIYMKPDSYTIENPSERARRWAEEYDEKILLEKKVEDLSNEIHTMKPKAEYFDSICDSSLLTNFRDAAKQLGMSQTQFTGFLKDNRYVYMTNSRSLRPTEMYRKSGLFQMKSFVNKRNGFSGVRTFLTVKGMQYFRMLFNENVMKIQDHCE